MGFAIIDTDIVPDPIKPPPDPSSTNSKAPAVDKRRTDFQLSQGIGRACCADPVAVINQSKSGNGGSARLKGWACGVQMNELGIGGQI
jgi:hypothetical protein